MYDSFSREYDRFVNWPSRLAMELPFIQHTLQQVGAGRSLHILDAACGTGMHAIALTKAGHVTAGADLSAGMIKRARENALAEEVNIRFETAGFGELGKVFGTGTFEALLCLGNSLPHLLSPEDLAATLADFAACLSPGGLVLIQNRNFDSVLSRKERWMEPQAYQQAEREWLYLRFYDFEPDGLISFNIITLERVEAASWVQSITTTRLYPLRQSEMSVALSEAGFRDITCFGNMAGDPFEPQGSGNLVVQARI
jgi:glycine/sarcosine N-methyltransferase